MNVTKVRYSQIGNFFSVVFIAMTFLFSTTACEELNNILDDTGLTEAEVVEGLKAALTVGTDTAVSQANIAGGYLNNQLIKIVLPDEANNLLNFANSLDSEINNLPFGAQLALGTLLDDVALPAITNLTSNLVTQMNGAAENAADKAAPIFVNAITGITIEDGFAILNGGDRSATDYLENATTTSLSSAFQPDIQDALEAINAQQTWQQITSKYNAAVNTLSVLDNFGLADQIFPQGLQPVETDLAQHTTDKALVGLFHLVGEEEKQIRTDPVARVTDILAKVFGN